MIVLYPYSTLDPLVLMPLDPSVLMVIMPFMPLDPCDLRLRIIAQPRKNVKTPAKKYKDGRHFTIRTPICQHPGSRRDCTVISRLDHTII